MHFLCKYERSEVSNKTTALDTAFCLNALEEAIYLYGKPDISNTDQGAQFTSNDLTNILKSHDIQISMDGKGC